MTAPSRRCRIQRLIAIARRAADPADPLGIEIRERLLRSSDLTREGIELALTNHLETNPTEAEVDALLASLGRSDAPRCHVVIAANVCTSALRSIAVALSVSSSVLVRPSSRDPVLADILVRELAQDELFRGAGGAIDLESDVNAAPGDELHIYGSDATVQALRAAMPPGVVVRGHGTGFGVALIGEDAELRIAAEDLAADVIPFDQRGCLSPRIALVEGPSERAELLWEALDEALCSTSIPRGPLDEAALAELSMYRASIEAVGAFREGPWHAVGLDSTPRSLLLPPPLRIVHIAPATAESVGPLLAPWAPFIAALGASGETPLIRSVHAIAPNARRSPLGKMQLPPFDGPVDRRPDGAGNE